MANRHLDNLKALRVRGTWRYLRTQPASFWLICIYLFIEYVRPQRVWPVIDVLPWSQTTVLLCAGALLLDRKKLEVPTLAGSTLLVFTSVLLFSSITAYRPDVAQANLAVYLEWFACDMEGLVSNGGFPGGERHCGRPGLGPAPMCGA